MAHSSSRKQCNLYFGNLEVSKNDMPSTWGDFEYYSHKKIPVLWCKDGVDGDFHNIPVDPIFSSSSIGNTDESITLAECKRIANGSIDGRSVGRQSLPSHLRHGNLRRQSWSNLPNGCVVRKAPQGGKKHMYWNEGSLTGSSSGTYDGSIDLGQCSRIASIDGVNVGSQSLPSHLRYGNLRRQSWSNLPNGCVVRKALREARSTCTGTKAPWQDRLAAHTMIALTWISAGASQTDRSTAGRSAASPYQHVCGTAICGGSPGRICPMGAS